jgi:hypothetical protein
LSKLLAAAALACGAFSMPVLADADTKPPKDPIWIVELTPGHVAYVRLRDKSQTDTRTAELRIVYKVPLTAEGGDVMVFELDFGCANKPAEASATFLKGELWKRNPPALLSELG